MAKKIAVFLPSLEGGGAERVALTIANILADQSAGVDLVLVERKGVYDKHHLISDKLHVVNFKKRRVRYALLDTVRYLRRAKPDIVLSHLTQVNLLVILSLLLVPGKVRLIICEHSTLSRVMQKKSAIFRLFFALLYRIPLRVIAVSEGVAQDLRDYAMLPTDKVITIHNPIEVAAIKELAKQPLPSEAEPFFNNKPPFFVAAGRLTEVKNFILLIKAFSLVHRKHPESRLVILGEGEQRETLTQLIRELQLEQVVYMPGFVENPFCFFSKAKALVLSSHYEGLPSVIIEAFACACPVISVDCAHGPREILADGAFGTLVPMRDIDALANAMAKQLLAESPLDSEKLLARANNFTEEAAMQKYLREMGLCA